MNDNNPFPRNPFEIHTIQDELIALPGNAIFVEGIRVSAKNDLNGTLKMILEQSRDNRVSMAGMIGEKLLRQIENLC